MMGRQDRDQGQLFYEFNLDEVIPKEHLLRRMNVFVTDGSASLISATGSRITPRFRSIVLSAFATATSCATADHIDWGRMFAGECPFKVVRTNGGDEVLAQAANLLIGRRLLATRLNLDERKFH
jgi:hypothetical protein